MLTVPNGASASPADPMVAFDNVGFGYDGRRPVLDHFTCRSTPGDVLALVGRSGAGKSTLLKLVNRLLLPDAGDVFGRGPRHARVGSDSRCGAASATCCRTSACFRT